jgi:hypothetical protein
VRTNAKNDLNLLKNRGKQTVKAYLKTQRVFFDEPPNELLMN